MKEPNFDEDLDKKLNEEESEGGCPECERWICGCFE